MKKTMTFEQALARLEEIVAALDEEGIAIERSIELFSEGAGLVDFCNKTLESAKLKVEQLLPTAAKEEDE